MLCQYDVCLNVGISKSYTYKNTDKIRSFKGMAVKKC